MLPDVNPLTLGVETSGAIMTKVLYRGHMLPIVSTVNFTTAHDDQRTANIRIFEGERLLSKDNIPLGKLVLRNLPPLPRGSLRIVVQTAIDEDGNVEVNAQEPITGLNGRLVIKSTQRSSQEELDRSISEAQIFWEADQEDVARLIANHHEEEAPADAIVKFEDLDDIWDHSEL